MRYLTFSHGQIHSVAACAGIDDPAMLDGPLRTAAALGRDSVVELLLGWGADPHSVDAAGSTPMNLACAGGHLGTVRLLLRWGADFSSLGDHSGG